VEINSDDGFDKLALAGAYVREFVFQPPKSLELRIIRLNSHDGSGNGIAEEGSLAFRRIETCELLVTSDPWLEILSSQSHSTSPLREKFNNRFKAGEVWFKEHTKFHFELRFEHGCVNLLAESYEYEITKLSPAKVIGTPPQY
jgi:hypothetical protein